MQSSACSLSLLVDGSLPKPNCIDQNKESIHQEKASVITVPPIPLNTSPTTKMDLEQEKKQVELNEQQQQIPSNRRQSKTIEYNSGSPQARRNLDFSRRSSMGIVETPKKMKRRKSKKKLKDEEGRKDVKTDEVPLGEQQAIRTSNQGVSTSTQQPVPMMDNTTYDPFGNVFSPSVMNDAAHQYRLPTYASAAEITTTSQHETAEGNDSDQEKNILKKNLEKFRFGHQSPRTDSSPQSGSSVPSASRNSFSEAQNSRVRRSIITSYNNSAQNMRHQLSELSRRQKQLNYGDSDDDLVHSHDDGAFSSDDEYSNQHYINNNTNFTMSVPDYSTLSPLSPARINFQNISSVRILTEQLEKAAESIIKHEERNALWEEWIILLRDSEMPGSSNVTYMDDNCDVLTFKEVFIKSRAIEIIAEGIILYPDSGSQSLLWELFRYTLLGDHQDLMNLITSLKKIGSLIRGKPLNVIHPVIGMAIEIVSNFKAKPEQQKLLINSLDSLDKQILIKEKLLQQEEMKPQCAKTYMNKAQISGELVRLLEQKRELLLSFSQKWYVMDGTRAFLDHCVEAVGASDRTQNCNIQNQLEQLSLYKMQTEKEYHAKIEELNKNISSIKIREQQLLDVKKELEYKLMQVDNDLKTLQIKLHERGKEKQDYQSELVRIQEEISMKENELTRSIAAEGNDSSIFDALSEFVQQSRDILLNTLEKRTSGLEQLVFQSTERYIEQAAVYLENQNLLMIDILKTKILNFCEKLKNFKKPYLEAVINENDEDIRSKMKKIKHYYSCYLNAEKSAKDILVEAESLNQFIHSLPYLEQYSLAIEQIDNQLSVLSDSENLMLKCNNSIQWVPIEINNFEKQFNLPQPSSNANGVTIDQDNSVSTDSSDLSNNSHNSHHSESQVDKERLAHIQEFLKAHHNEVASHSLAIPLEHLSRSRSSSNSSNNSAKVSSNDALFSMLLTAHQMPHTFNYTRTDVRRSSIPLMPPPPKSTEPTMLEQRRNSLSTYVAPTEKPKM